MLMLMLMLTLMLMLMLLYYTCCNLGRWTSILGSVNDGRHCHFELAAAESLEGCSTRKALKT